MPGSSRMPISLRDGLNSVKKSRHGNPIQFLNVEL
jgi:sphinganine-1-phosphate aldolase